MNDPQSLCCNHRPANFAPYLQQRARLYAPYVNAGYSDPLCVRSSFYTRYLVRHYRSAATNSSWKPIYFILHRDIFYSALPRNVQLSYSQKNVFNKPMLECRLATRFWMTITPIRTNPSYGRYRDPPHGFKLYTKPIYLFGHLWLISPIVASPFLFISDFLLASALIVGLDIDICANLSGSCRATLGQ